MFSLEPLAQDPRKEIMDLSRVNLFTPLSLPCSALPRTWNWSCVGHSGLVVSAANLVRITFRTGCKILFRRILGRALRVPCWLRVWYTCVAGSPFMYCLGTEIYFFGSTKPTRNTWTYFVSEIFHDGTIFNTSLSVGPLLPFEDFTSILVSPG